MYAELEICFKESIGAAHAKSAVIGMVGENSISIKDAIRDTPLETYTGILNAALAAEDVLNQATIIYFRQGDDTIKAHIKVKSLVDAKKQCERITRQLSKSLARKSTANASILVEVGASDEAVIQGEKLPVMHRLWHSMAEKFASRFVPAGVSFALAALFLKDTPVFKAAIIGATASMVGVVAEGLIALRGAKEWKWKDMQ